VSENARIYNTAHVYGNAVVKGDAYVGYQAHVYDDALVTGKAQISCRARIYGKSVVHESATVTVSAHVFDNSVVKGNAIVSGKARICGSARVCGNASVVDKACVKGHAVLYGDVIIQDNAEISGEVELFGRMTIRGNAEITDDSCFVSVSSFGRNTSLTAFVEKDGNIAFALTRREALPASEFLQQMKKEYPLDPHIVQNCKETVAFMLKHLKGKRTRRDKLPELRRKQEAAYMKSMQKAHKEFSKRMHCCCPWMHAEMLGGMCAKMQKENLSRKE
jgi:carbonic anhydrase/acetyltransferase-like protein (isoleucine patch superfamily)